MELEYIGDWIKRIGTNPPPADDIDKKQPDSATLEGPKPGSSKTAVANIVPLGPTCGRNVNTSFLSADTLCSRAGLPATT